MIDSSDPDVLALQEVGPAEVLADLNEACAIDFDFRLTGTADDRGIRVALMSPRRLSHRRDMVDFPPGVLPVQCRDTEFDPATTSQTSRGVLSATVRSGGERVTVMTCHLKSKLISYPRPPGAPEGATFNPRDEGERFRYAGYAIARRSAEAMTCRAALDEVLTAPGDAVGEGPGTGRQTPVIFCGDLNDEPHGGDDADHPRAGRLGDRLPPGSGFQNGDSGDGWRMWNLAPLLTAPAYTRIYRGRGELIDHIFASHRLVNPTNLPTVDTVAVTPLPSMTDTPSRAPAVRPRRGGRHVHRVTPGAPPARGDPPDRHRGRMQYVLPMVEGAGR